MVVVVVLGSGVVVVVVVVVVVPLGSYSGVFVVAAASSFCGVVSLSHNL